MSLGRNQVSWSLGAAAILAASSLASASQQLPARFPYARDERVVFSIGAPPVADVRLVGDFNSWDPVATPLEPATNGLWEAALPLQPGEYRYRFLVDGQSRLDPANPDEVRSGDGGISSRIRVLRDGQVSRSDLWQRDAIRDRDWALRPVGVGDFSVGASVAFNRVDGTSFWAKPSLHSSAPFVPDIDAKFGYGWESERLTTVLDLAQPLTRGRDVCLGLVYTHGTAADNEAEIGIGENTLAGLFLKHDFMDYYMIDGWEPYARLRLVPSTWLRLGFASEKYRSLTTQTQWSFFGAGADEFRPNPHLYLLGDPEGFGGEGRLVATRLELVRDTRRARHSGTIGFYGRGFLELGAGDFDYVRWLADLRSYARLGRPSHLAMRFRAGARVLGDAIPSQKLFDVGGLGTVRGHAFFAQVGDRELLGNVEYTLFSEHINQGLFFFYDLGTAWNSLQDRFVDATVLQSVGTGVRSLNDDFQVLCAWPVGPIAGHPEVSVRLNRTF